MDTPFILFFVGGMPFAWLMGRYESSRACGAIRIRRIVSPVPAILGCALFVILGATLSGEGSGRALAMAGQLHASCAALITTGVAALILTTAWFLGHAVPAVQILVGTLIGALLHEARPYDLIRFTPILAGWLSAPFVAALLGRSLYQTGLFWLARRRVHLLTRYALTRQAWMLASLFAAYALGANNLAAVTGPYLAVQEMPWGDQAGSMARGTLLLLLFGGFAMAAGLGARLVQEERHAPSVESIPLSPLGMAVATLSAGVTLMLFASESLETLLTAVGLPAFPLVPLSLDQTLAGAVAGIASIHGPQFIDWRFWLRAIAGMLLIPLLAACVTLCAMFMITYLINLCVIP
ncbi:MAG: hypothetical protein HQL86_01870 [Magnetococcales bacterium]|nr:hypothetical protein [Magnetococcales bacterium]